MAIRTSYVKTTREDKTSIFAGGLTINGTMSFGDAATDTLSLTGLTTVSTDQKIQFRDTGIYINSGADGKLTLSADGTGADDITLSGTVTISDDVVLADDKDLALGGSGTLTSGTGAIALNGDTTVATAKTLIVTDADAITVAGVIVPQEMVVTVPVSATSVDGTIFIANDAWVITKIEEVHSVLGTDGSAVTAQVMKCTTTQAPSAGTAMTTGTFDLKGTVETVQSGTLSGTAADYTLADGDRIAVDYTGTLTTLAGGVITIHMKRA